MLFENKIRTRQEPLRRGEGLFEFYDSCDRAGYGQYRALVNGWLSAMPPDDSADLVSRMRNGGDREFQSSLCELIAHSWILASGRRAVVHPNLKGTNKHPDFGVNDPKGETIAYVEVTTINPRAAQVAEVNRENPIYNAINSADLPVGAMLGYDLVRAGANNPRLGPLIAEIEQWARDNLEQARRAPVRFVAGGWEIELELFAGTANEVAREAIGVAWQRGGWIAPLTDLRRALGVKSSRYGDLRAPYVIVAADAREQLWGADRIRDAVIEAVMGDEVAVIPQGGRPRPGRAGNGFWHSRTAPRNCNVSAILLLPNPEIWKLREPNHQPLLAINPWTEREVPASLRSLTRIEAVDDRWTLREGELLADLIGLPNPWPPEERH
jgi:hypothetical protein